MKFLTALVCVLLFAPVLVLADDDSHGDDSRHESHHRHDRLLLPDQPNAKWLSECGDCHIAYPPELLPERTWTRIMSGLNKHFGADATLSDTDRKEITAFLVKNASGHWSGYTSRIRITETPGFQRRHRKMDLPERMYDRPSIKSAANCQACHQGAAQGDFDEHRVKVPD